MDAQGQIKSKWGPGLKALLLNAKAFFVFLFLSLLIELWDFKTTIHVIQREVQPRGLFLYMYA